MTDKGVIYKHVKNLKDNPEAKDYYINDHLPEELHESQRKRKQIVKYNRTLIKAQQQDIDWQKGDLIVDGKVYQPKVVEPTAADILKMSKDPIAL